MKLIIILILIFFSSNTFAQKNDTLTIPVCEYKFIKIGDKVYKLEVNLIEVKEEKKFSGLMLDTIGINPSNPIYLPNYFHQWESLSNPSDIFKNY